jgi:uncharacterized protein YjbJ (UPF0337 family)
MSGISVTELPPSKQRPKGSTSSNVYGAANQLTRNGNQTNGCGVDNPALEGEGTVQEINGLVQSATGKAKEQVKYSSINSEYR